MPTSIVWRLVLARPLLHVSKPLRHPDEPRGSLNLRALRHVSHIRGKVVIRALTTIFPPLPLRLPRMSSRFAVLFYTRSFRTIIVPELQYLRLDILHFSYISLHSLKVIINQL